MNSFITKFFGANTNTKPLLNCFSDTLKPLSVGGYWRTRYLMYFRCNGNDGGWRTRFCDWLEDKARKNEEHAENKLLRGKLKRFRDENVINMSGDAICERGIITIIDANAFAKSEINDAITFLVEEWDYCLEMD